MGGNHARLDSAEEKISEYKDIEQKVPKIKYRGTMRENV